MRRTDQRETELAISATALSYQTRPSPRRVLGTLTRADDCLAQQSGTFSRYRRLTKERAVYWDAEARCHETWRIAERNGDSQTASRARVAVDAYGRAAKRVVLLGDACVEDADESRRGASGALDKLRALLTGWMS